MMLNMGRRRIKDLLLRLQCCERDCISEEAGHLGAKPRRRLWNTGLEDDDLVTVSKDSTPSPTASTLLIEFELEDIKLATEMNEKWMKEFSDAERAKNMKELLDECTAKREERERAAVEEMKRRMEEDDEEEQYKGKGKGKQV